MFEQSLSKDYNFDIDVTKTRSYVSFLIFEKLRGIIEKELFFRLSEDDFVEYLAQQILHNNRTTDLSKFILNPNIKDKQHTIRIKSFIFESFDKLLNNHTNIIAVRFSEEEGKYVKFIGKTSQRIIVDHQITVSSDSNTLSIYSEDTNDSLFDPIEYISNINVEIVCDEIVEICSFVYLKEDEVSVPKGIIRLEISKD